MLNTVVSSTDKGKPILTFDYNIPVCEHIAGDRQFSDRRLTCICIGSTKGTI